MRRPLGCIRSKKKRAASIRIGVSRQSSGAILVKMLELEQTWMRSAVVGLIVHLKRASNQGLRDVGTADGRGWTPMKGLGDERQAGAGWNSPGWAGRRSRFGGSRLLVVDRWLWCDP